MCPWPVGEGEKAGKPVTDNAIVLPICLGIVGEDVRTPILLPCVHLCVCLVLFAGRITFDPGNL